MKHLIRSNVCVQSKNLCTHKIPSLMIRNSVLPISANYKKILSFLFYLLSLSSVNTCEWEVRVYLKIAFDVKFEIFCKLQLFANDCSIVCVDNRLRYVIQQYPAAFGSTGWVGIMHPIKRYPNNFLYVHVWIKRIFAIDIMFKP